MHIAAQAGKGSATLSMAYAAAAFAESCLKAMAGEPGVVECAYVQVRVLMSICLFNLAESLLEPTPATLVLQSAYVQVRGPA